MRRQRPHWSSAAPAKSLLVRSLWDAVLSPASPAGQAEGCVTSAGPFGSRGGRNRNPGWVLPFLAVTVYKMRDHQNWFQSFIRSLVPILSER